MVTKPTKSGLLAISTGTVAGAAVLALFSTLLGPKAPWFVDKLFAGPRDGVTFTVDQLAMDRPSSVPKSSDTYADAALRFQLTSPSSDWKISKLDPGRTLGGLSIFAVPLFKMTFTALAPMIAVGRPQSGDLITTEFVAPGAAPLISFTDSSEVDGYPISLNPTDDPGYFEASLRTGARLTGIDSAEVTQLLTDTTEEGRAVLNQVKQVMRHHLDSAIQSNWPAPQHVQSSVTVTTFGLAYLKNMPSWSALIRTERPAFATILGMMQFINSELMSANIKNLQVSQDNRFALLDVSMPLRNIQVDSVFVADAELRRFALIAHIGDVIHVVTLQFLNAGRSGSTYDSLKELFESFRVYR